MGLKSTFSKPGNANKVDKYIGTAYDEVKVVSDNIEAILAVEANIENSLMYLGAHASTPTQRLDGSPIQNGDFFLNTTDDRYEYYDEPGNHWEIFDLEAAIAAQQAAEAARDTANQYANDSANSASAAAGEAANSAASADKAKQWAEEVTDVPVESGKFSAKHWAEKSSDFATASSNSANDSANSAVDSSNFAADSANSANASANSAADSLSSANDAALSETNAALSEAAAQLAEQNAQTHEANAASSAADAQLAETGAQTSEINAGNHAAAASVSETNAAASEAAAAASAQEAADYVNSLAGGLDFKGDWDASLGNFPTPSLSPEKADYYVITVAGTMSDGVQPDVTVRVGDNIMWHTVRDEWFDVSSSNDVLSVNGKTGTVVLTHPDVGALGATENAVSASKWQNARTLSLSGGATGSVSLDGTSDVDITVTVDSTQHNHDDRYYTESEVDTLDAQNVKLTDDQSVAGIKTFTSNEVEISGTSPRLSLIEMDSPDEGVNWNIIGDGGNLSFRAKGAAETWLSLDYSANLISTTSQNIAVNATTPVSANHLTRKDYVDGLTGTLTNEKVSKSGDTMTGELTIRKSGNNFISVESSSDNNNAGIYFSETAGNAHGAAFWYDGYYNRAKISTWENSGSLVDALYIDRGTSDVRAVGGVYTDSVQRTASNSLTRKDYVDGLDAQNVKITGNQTISGTKTFPDSIHTNERIYVDFTRPINTLLSMPYVPDGGEAYINWTGGNDLIKFQRGTSSDNNTITLWGKVVAGSSQSSLANAFTRKDYVDGLTNSLSSRVGDIEANYVTTDTAQTISGDKSIANVTTFLNSGLYGTSADYVGFKGGVTSGIYLNFINDDNTLNSVIRADNGIEGITIAGATNAPILKALDEDITLYRLGNEKLRTSANGIQLEQGVEIGNGASDSLHISNANGAVSIGSQNAFHTHYTSSTGSHYFYGSVEAADNIYADNYFLRTGSSEQVIGYANTDYPRIRFTDDSTTASLILGAGSDASNGHIYLRPRGTEDAVNQAYLSASGTFTAPSIESNNANNNFKLNNSGVGNPWAWEYDAGGGMKFTEQGVATRMTIGTDGVIRQHAAQGSQVDSLTRKDYVDTEVGNKVNKAGDTMTGTLVAPTVDITDQLQVPVENVRTGAQGDIRFNDTTETFEGHDGTAWGAIGGGGGVAWEPILVNTTAETGTGYLIAADALTLTLPATPREGFTVGIGDYQGLNFTATVARNGENIMGLAEDFTFDTKNATIVFSYVDATVGWILTQGFGESDAPQAIANKYRFTNVAGQSVFNVASVYDNYVDVYYNGLKLDPETDYTVDSQANTVTLTEAVDESDDIVEIYGWNQALVLNASDIGYDNSTSGLAAGTMQGAIDEITSLTNVVSNPNILMNGDMKLNQRNWSGAVTGAAYTLDRWVISNADNVTQGINVPFPPDTKSAFGGTHSLTVVTSAGQDTQIAQFNELPQPDRFMDIMNGKTFTFSAWVYSSGLSTLANAWMVRATSSSSSPGTRTHHEYQEFLGGGVPLVNNGWTYITKTFTANFSGGQEGNSFGIRFDPPNEEAGTLVVTSVKLEEGSVATPFIPDTPAVSLAKCQRYYFDSGIGLLRDGTNGTAGHPARFPMTFPDMRVIPSTSVNVTVIDSSNCTYSGNYSAQDERGGWADCNISNTGAWYIRLRFKVNTEL